MITINTKYSEKQWKTISRIAQLTGILMSTADYSGVQGTKDELSEALTSILLGERQFPGNELILSMIPKGASEEETLENLKNQQQELIRAYRITNTTELKAFQKTVFGDYAEVLHNIRTQETGSVVKEFRHWILNIAEAVAVTAIEGSFLSENPDPFSEEERVIFNKINKAFSN